MSESLGDKAQVTIIDKSDAFIFGFSKLDVMFGRDDPRRGAPPVREIRQAGGAASSGRSITAIDPAARRVTTDAGVHECDYLVVALGADYDMAATPGLENANEFYSVAGANALRAILPTFVKGHALVGVCGAPYKCPPAPSECALMLHDLLTSKGVRGQCEITLVLPLPSPVPPSPDTSKALIAAFAERDIRFMPNRRVTGVDASPAGRDAR